MSFDLDEAMRATIAIAACLAFFGSFAAAEEQRLSYRRQGVERTALLRRPDSLVGRKAALVVALHGLGGAGESFANWSGFDAVANREGFAVVYPTALEGRWNYGKPINAAVPQVDGAPADDIGFVLGIVDDLVAKGVADPRRIYVAGVSRGALMTYALACVPGRKIAAIAPIISGMTDAQIEDCRPARALPLVGIGGSNDFVQFYDGFLAERGRLASVPETLEYWRRNNGCAKQTLQRLPHLNQDDHTSVIVLDWSECREGARMRFYRVNGGGHQIPTKEATPLEEKKLGRRNRDFEAAEVVWAFIRDFALPEP